MRLADIRLYPIKSLDGVSVPSARFARGGGLEHDRVYALFDTEGNHVNGKREPRIQRIRSTFAADFTAVTLAAEGFATATIPFADTAELEGWFSTYFGKSVCVRHDPERGFPDDTESPGPTVIARETLAEFASWFPGLTAEEMLRRLRANLVLEGGGPFADDRLFGPPGLRVSFSIGDVELWGNNPCQRCPVPTRDSFTGEALPRFQKTFADRRDAALPAWTDRGRFNHYYRAAVNTVTPPASLGREVRVGDLVRLNTLCDAIE